MVWGGVSGGFSDLFSGNGLMVTLSFGIPTTIGLLSGTFGDQMFWQQVFLCERRQSEAHNDNRCLYFCRCTYFLGGIWLFAAGTGLAISDTQARQM